MRERSVAVTKTLLYNPQLDGLRFCAVLLVVSYHWIPAISETQRGFFLGGLINFFFVLSGYLITRILISAKEKSVRYNVSNTKTILGFYLRRAIRIFPAYYFILFICVLLPITGAEVRNNAAAYFLYFSNYTMYKHQLWPPITAQFWSLAVEEQFYLVWPLLIILINEKYWLRIFLFIIATSIIIRAFYFHPVFPVPLSTLTQFSIDAFAIGGVLAYKYTYATFEELRFIKKWTSILTYVGIPVCIITIAIESYSLSFVFSRFLFAVFSVKIIEGAINGYKGWFGAFLENRIVTRIGQISYGIYLWHLLIPVLFWNLYNAFYAYLDKQHPYFFLVHKTQIISFEKIFTSTFVCYIIYSTLTLAAAFLSWHVIEKPFDKLKSLIKISPSQPTGNKHLRVVKSLRSSV